MVYLNTNTANQTLRLTLDEARQYFSTAFTHYLLILTHEENSTAGNSLAYNLLGGGCNFLSLGNSFIQNLAMYQFSNNTFVDGNKEGLNRSLYLNGQLAREYTYVGGKFHGLYQEWYSNGQKEEDRSVPLTFGYTLFENLETISNERP